MERSAVLHHGCEPRIVQVLSPDWHDGNISKCVYYCKRQFYILTCMNHRLTTGHAQTMNMFTPRFSSNMHESFMFELILPLLNSVHALTEKNKAVAVAAKNGSTLCARRPSNKAKVLRVWNPCIGSNSDAVKGALQNDACRHTWTGTCHVCHD